MSIETQINEYRRQLTPIERTFTRSPYSIVSMVVRIKGNVTEAMLRDSIRKAQFRHPNLRSRIIENERHEAWLTSQGAQGIAVSVVIRESDSHWIKAMEDSYCISFDFDVRPPIRFILVQSPTVSELLILCHHIICDGLSLAFLARDLMTYLGDPDQKTDTPPESQPVNLNTIPDDVSVNFIARYFINRINRKWQKQAVYFDHEDYINIHEAYWKTYKHSIRSEELSETHTAELVSRCKKESVTVNSALSVAFVGAQAMFKNEFSFHPLIAVAGSMRRRLRVPAGEGMGFFAGIITLKYRYNEKIGFWDNVRQFQNKAKPMYINKNLFKDHIAWCYLDPTILEAINFKKLGKLVPRTASRFQKLSDFTQREDVVSSILRREKMESLDKVFMGTAITNLTRMDFPRYYGELELDRLIMNPGGGFPLVNVNLVLSAVTCSGKLSLLIEFEEHNINTGLMDKIQNKALDFLLGK